MGTSGLQYIVDDVISQLGSGFSATNVVIGRRETETTKTYPRIVFISQGGPIGVPDRVGAGLPDPAVQTRQRIIAVRHFDAICEIHAQDDYTAEIVLEAVCLALRTTSLTSVALGQESWPDQDPEQDSFDKAGSLVQFTFTINFPIYDQAQPLTALISFVELSETFNGEAVTCTT